MTQKDRLLARFAECRGPFSYRDFKRLMLGQGYEELTSGRTSGSQTKFVHVVTKRIVSLHAPHDDEMRPGLVRRLQKDLEEHGVL